ncbi:MAG: type II toxin-antitoxin system ParD family antitoxin [Candidatus Acidiferrales bacterium]
MSISIDPELETKIRARAEAVGLSIEAYLERLVQADRQGTEELEALALEGLESGAPIEAGPSYWQDKHRQLDERLKKTETR